MPQQRLRLGELLITSGLLRKNELHRALDQQKRFGGLLGTNLLELDALGEKDLLRALGRQMSAPTVEATDLVNIPEVVLARLPRATATDYHLLPFRLHGNTILIAAMRPGDLRMEDAIQAQTQLMTRVHIGLEVRIWEALHRFYKVEAPLRVARLLAKLNGKRRSPTGRPRQSVPIADPAFPLPRGPAVRPLIPPATGPVPSIADEVLWQAIELDSAGQEATRKEPPKPALEASAPAPERPVPAAEPVPEPKTDPHSTAEVSVVVEPPRAETIDQAIGLLRTTERRERIAELVMQSTSPLLKRRFLLAARGKRIIGWRGEGPGLERVRVHGLNFDAAESPIFLALDNGASFWLGPIVDRPIHKRLLGVFGGLIPPDCVVVPIRVRDKSVAYLYGDNERKSVAGVPLDDLQRLADQAAGALVTYLYRRRQATTDAPIS